MLAESREEQRPGTEQKDLYTCPEDFRLIRDVLSGFWPTGKREGWLTKPSLNLH